MGLVHSVAPHCHQGSPFFPPSLSENSGYSPCVHKIITVGLSLTSRYGNTGRRKMIVPSLVTLFINKKMFLGIPSPSPEDLPLYHKWPAMGTGTSLNKSLPRGMEPVGLAYPRVTEEKPRYCDKSRALLRIPWWSSG